MNALTITEALSGNTYPGRGIIVSRTAFAYFIMGRSENSRNRVFEKTDDGIRTRAFDPSKLTDPSLVIYNAVRRLGGTAIITNGEQTDTIIDTLKSGGHFHSGVRAWIYEPDPPIFTPRISAITRENGAYTLCIVKNIGGETPAWAMFDYPHPLPGVGHLIHTYKCDGNPVPSFEGEPAAVKIPDSLAAFADEVWSSLNPENRVALYVSDRACTDEYIINRHTEGI